MDFLIRFKHVPYLLSYMYITHEDKEAMMYLPSKMYIFCEQLLSVFFIVFQCNVLPELFAFFCDRKHINILLVNKR